MDALKFLMERKRMCRTYSGCRGCPLEGTKCVISHVTPDVDYERIIATVEKWSKDHPRKTRQSVFLEQWPEALVYTDGVLDICPAVLFRAYREEEEDYGKCSGLFEMCAKCRREFWGQEVE